MTDERLKAKFVGALLGTFAGDALGMPVEGWSAERIARTFGQVEDLRSAAVWLRGYSALSGLLTDPAHALSSVRLGRGRYTDDTQMMIGIAESLVGCGGFDVADMARRFVDNFDPRRGYAAGAMKALRGLRHGLPWNEVGQRLFAGGGSFGNGAAMRVAPVGVLYCHDAGELRRVAELSASITHAHPLGKEGAALQAFAVACAARLEPSQGLDSSEFLRNVRSFVRRDCEEFQRKLCSIAVLLQRQSSATEIADTLGNDVTAHGSVPAALYSFLAHPGSFKDALVCGVSLGGDTDTIGAMAGAIAGAFHGVEAIPRDWMEALENREKGRDYVQRLAEQLWRRHCDWQDPARVRE